MLRALLHKVATILDAFLKIRNCSMMTRWHHSDSSKARSAEHESVKKTSSPKGNDAYLRATIQSEKKWEDQFFRRLRAANSVVRGQIWLNFKLIQALMYVIITCKYEKDPIKNNREKVATQFFKL